MWCPLPWTHVSVKNNGILRVCSHSQSAGTGNTLLVRGRKTLSVNDLSPDVLNNDTSKQIRKDIMEGRWPSQCKRCQIEFESKGTSRNVWETKAQSLPTNQLLQNTLEDGTLVDPQITSYDLRIGNFCNLRCVMCFPGESSKWYDIYEDVMEANTFYVDGKNYKIEDGVDQFNWIRQRSNVDQIINSAPNLSYLSLSGGEPVAIKHHMDILRGFIDQGSSKQITLEYQTNGTTIPQSLFALWKQFKKVKIGVSIDGLKEANEASRFPSKWEVIEQTLRTLDNSEDNIDPYISTTIHILSLESYSSLIKWLELNNYNKIKTFNSHIVFNPKYLCIGILQEDQFKNIFGSTDSLYKLYKQVKLSDTEAEQHRKDFVNKFFKFQLLQSQDWQLIFPKAYNVVLEWKEKYEI